MERSVERSKRIIKTLLVVDGTLGLSVLGTAMGVAVYNGLGQITEALFFYMTKIPHQFEYTNIDNLTKVYKEILLPATIAYSASFALIYNLKSRYFQSKT